MRVFITGATGFVGRQVVKELISGGHKVLGLARSEAGAQALAAAGAEVQRGVLEDIEIIKSGAAASDAVIHLGFNHESADFMASCKIDQQVIEALGAVLAGSSRPLIVTSGVGGLAKAGELATEASVLPPNFPFPRVSEPTALSLLSQKVSAAVMRLPQVHDTAKQGLVTFAINVARQKGVSNYVGEGTNRWSAAHVRDVAQLYRLALEQHEAGAKWHAVAEEGVRYRDIAETIGRGLKVPVKSMSAEAAPAHFGWWGGFVGADLLASSTLTRQKLGWNPTGPGLLADLEKMDYARMS